MHDNITRIDEHPIALRHALDPQIAEALRLEPLDELIGNGRDMAVRAAGGDDHLIGESALAVEIDRCDVFGLGVIEAGEYCGEEFGSLLAFRCRLVGGDAFAGAATLGCGFQGVSSSSNGAARCEAPAALSVMTVLNSGSFFKDSAGTLF